MRAVAAGGRPFSTTSPVGSSVAGSIVSTQTPSNGTARRQDAGGAERELAHVGAAVRQPDEVAADAVVRLDRHASIVARRRRSSKFDP